MNNLSLILDIILSNGLVKDLLKGKFGIEKENLRVDKDGNIAATKHPEAFGNKLENPFITVDFAESQVEMITPPLPSIQEMYNFLENLHDIISMEIDNEYLWPQSTPANLQCINNTPSADFDNSESGQKAKNYRKMLIEKYGTNRQLLSGIHYNFSFDEKFLKKLYEKTKTEDTYKNFKDNIYLKVARNYTRYRWLIIYLMGASSSIHKSYNKCTKNLEILGDDYFLKDGVSFRHTKCGYRNTDNLFVPLDSLDTYTESLKNLIKTGVLSDHREYYSPIRLKNTKNTLDSLLEEGIEYLEVRTIDLNPYSKVGIELKDLYFLHMFLLFCLFKDELDNTENLLNKEEFDIVSTNQDLVAEKGLDKNLILTCENGKSIKIQEFANKLIEEITELENKLGINNGLYKDAISFEKNKVSDNSLTYASKLSKDIRKNTFIKFHIDKAKEYLNSTKKNEFLLKGYEDLELSTQILIKAGIKRGIAYEIIDRDENFVEFKKSNHRELVKQATKTSLDSYSSVLAMENKVVTKVMLERHGISTPKGVTFQNKEEALDAYNLFAGKPIVIKPKSENFGIGITIFKYKFDKSEYTKAIDLAFKSGGNIIIEEFVEGDEYRFLVIDNEVPGILRRVPANVAGNGINTISELVDIKNQDPLRGKGYKTPLEKISLGITEEMFLKQTNRTFNTIPKKGETVYLRENSNISTGGDSVDYTDDISDTYKQIAVESAKAVGAKICGVDMIIKDIKKVDPKGNYSIIEANFNPAIHIHSFPYIGKNRKIADKILNLLF